MSASDAEPRDEIGASDAEPRDAQAAQWYADHIGAGEEILRVLHETGTPVRGTRIADIGCGDGIIDLAIARDGSPAEVVGFDLNPTDTVHLLDQARRHGDVHELPPTLRFEVSETERIPAPDASFDLAVSWSAFEHIASPIAVAREIRRILIPSGVLFLQLWPFHPSEHGAHLWDWFPEGFVQHRLGDDEIKAHIEASDVDAWWQKYMWNEYRHLNRISLDELQRVLLTSGFEIIRAELMSNAVMLAPELGRHRLSDLLIGGVKLLAVAR